jgi:hypothetical protein
MTTGEKLLDEFRRERRAGDPRLSPEGREILRRITSGDFADEFADALTEIGANDPSLSPTNVTGSAK